MPSLFLRNEDPWCETRKNLFWDDERVNTERTRQFICKLDNPDFFRSLAKLEWMLMEYSEALYYYMIDLSRLYHGPYGDMFVKEFLHLKSELSKHSRKFPFDHYLEVGIYPNARIEVFFMGHTHIHPSFPEAIEHTRVCLDEKELDIDKLEDICKRVEAIVRKVSKELADNFDNTEFLLERGVKLFFYPLKPLYDELGLKWDQRVPETLEFAEKIKHKIKIPRPWGDMPKEKAIKLLMRKMEKYYTR